MLVAIAVLSGYTLHLLLESSVLLRDRILNERKESAAKRLIDAEEGHDAGGADEYCSLLPNDRVDVTEETLAEVPSRTSMVKHRSDSGMQEEELSTTDAALVIAVDSIAKKLIKYEKIDVYSYKSLAVGAFGPAAGIVFECCIFMLCIGILTGYNVISRRGFANDIPRISLDCSLELDGHCMHSIRSGIYNLPTGSATSSSIALWC